MIDLPILGREFPVLPWRSNKAYCGLVEVRCRDCGYTVCTFRKSVHRANSIVCPMCGAIYKEALNSIRIQKDYTKCKVVYGRNNKRQRLESEGATAC